MKSGTTWLYDVLRAHPNVSMPPIKEIRYFDEPETGFLHRLMQPRDKRYEYWRMQLRRALHPRRLARNPRWYARFFLRPRGPEWYRNLFIGRRKSGDVTPLYAPLNEDRVALAARTAPEARILYLLRDPVDRAWSHILLRCLSLVDWQRERITETLVRETVERRDLADEWLWRNGDYVDNLARWERHYPREQIFVGFYDELAENPALFLSGILQFLGLPERQPSAELLRRRSNERPAPISLPSDLEKRFARRYLEGLERLEARFGGVTTRWRERSQRAVSR